MNKIRVLLVGLLTLVGSIALASPAQAHHVYDVNVYHSWSSQRVSVSLKTVSGRIENISRGNALCCYPGVYIYVPDGDDVYLTWDDGPTALYQASGWRWIPDRDGRHATVAVIN